jgi:hypothetical protein
MQVPILVDDVYMHHTFRVITMLVPPVEINGSMTVFEHPKLNDVPMLVKFYI